MLRTSWNFSTQRSLYFALIAALSLATIANPLMASSGAIATPALQLVVDACKSCSTVTVSPLSPTVAEGEKLQFSATVTNRRNTAVTWSASAGSITSDGVFTAPKNLASKTITVTARSKAEGAAEASTAVTITEAGPRVSTSRIPDAVDGTVYSASLAASGGKPPYQWDVVSGALPVGLRLASKTGAVTGKATKTGAFAFGIRVTDAASHSAKQSLTLEVLASTVTCGPPDYGCSRTDTSFAPVPNPMPSWGGARGTNTVVTDPEFHNPIVRVTDASLGANHSFCTGLGGSGDVPNLWNADSTILLVCNDEGQYFPIGFDPTNFKSLGPLYGTNPNIFVSGAGVFSHTNPNQFYALSGGQLQSIDYTDRTSRPTPQLLYDFANCGVKNIGWKSFGGSDPTDTVFSIAFSLTAGQGTGYFVTVYNSETQVCFNLNTASGVVTQYPGATVIGTVNLPDRFYVHNVKMKGGTTVVVAPQTCISNCSNNPYGWVIGTTQLYGLGHPQGGGHWAAGCGKWLNQPGNPYTYNVVRDFLSADAPSSVWSVSASECGAAPHMSCTQPFDSHPAWLGDCSDTGAVCMATVSTNNLVRYPYQNEIVCFTTDGSSRQIRFAHTYSSLALGSSDAQWSIGQPSQDGRFYAWTTTAGGQFGCPGDGDKCRADEKRSDVLVVMLQ
jgi:putative Ig domain-containing protein